MKAILLFFLLLSAVFGSVNAAIVSIGAQLADTAVTGPHSGCQGTQLVVMNRRLTAPVNAETRSM